MDNAKRSGDIWLLASHAGDAEYKSTVQQLNIRIPHRLEEGEGQTISFDKIPDQKRGVKSVQLKAESSVGLPVYVYVKEGPGEVKDGQLVFTKIPPRSKFPVKVTVVAWQCGRPFGARVKTARPVKQCLYITK
jgi:hypothetical protein